MKVDDIAITTLLEKIDSLTDDRNKAMAATASPYNDQIAKLLQTVKTLRENKLAEKLFSEVTTDKDGNTVKAKKPRGKRVATRITNFDVYPFDAAIIDKFLFILKQENKFITIKELAAKVKTFENEDEVLIRNKFGKHINKYKANKLIVSIGSGHNTRYGLPDWIKQDGTVKAEYVNKLMGHLATENIGFGIGSFVAPLLSSTFIKTS